MNVAGGLRVEFRGYFADIRVAEVSPSNHGLVAKTQVADDRDLTRALGEAKRELIRQIDHHKSAREPMNSRQLRSETIRHPKQLGESP